MNIEHSYYYFRRYTEKRLFYKIVRCFLSLNWDNLSAQSWDTSNFYNYVKYNITKYLKIN